jgi:hypothetical protein
MFNLENFKFISMKNVLANILANLGEMNDKYDLLKEKVNGIEIPDMSKFNDKMADYEKRIVLGEKERKQLFDLLDR